MSFIFNEAEQRDGRNDLEILSFLGIRAPSGGGFKRVRGEKEKNYIKHSPKAIATRVYEAGLDEFTRSSNIAGFS